MNESQCGAVEYLVRMEPSYAGKAWTFTHGGGTNLDGKTVIDFVVATIGVSQPVPYFTGAFPPGFVDCPDVVLKEGTIVYMDFLGYGVFPDGHYRGQVIDIRFPTWETKLSYTEDWKNGSDKNDTFCWSSPWGAGVSGVMAHRRRSMAGASARLCATLAQLG